MKKLISFCLIICTLAVTLVACGGGGDTNMHKVMAAIEDGAIGTDGDSDVYSYTSSDAAPFTNGVCINENYNSVKMYARSNGHPGHRVDFHLSALKVVKDGHYENLKNTTVSYNGDDNVIIVNGFEYFWFDWAGTKWAGDSLFQSYYTDSITFDMNTYYTNGKFTVDDAVCEFHELTTNKFTQNPTYKDAMLTFIVDALNEGLSGLDEIYTQKGYPIKQAQQ